MNEILRVENVSFAYENKTRHILNEINLKVCKGEFVTISGRNGVGKTTLAKLINGFVKPDNGNIFIGNFNTKDEDSFWDIKKMMGIVFQNPDNQLLGLTIREELAFGPSNMGLSKIEIEKSIEKVLEVMGLKHEYHKNSSELSGGQRQKLAIAATLSMNPQIFVMDELTSMLDPFEKKEVFNLLKSLNKENGKTIINITHDLEEMMDGQRIVWLENGEITFDGKKDDFFQKHPTLKSNSLNFDLRKLENKNQEIIEVNNLSYEVRNGMNKTKQILKDITISIKAGEFVLIIGRNGSGKTSLINHLNGIILANTECIKIFDDFLSKKNLKNIRNKVAMVFQNPEHQFIRQNVYDDLSFSLKQKGVSDEEIEKRVNELIEILKIDKEIIKRSIFELSDGEKRKIAIGGVLAADPQIIILDEPTAGMDFYERENLIALYKKLKNELRKTVLIISHHVEDFYELADRTIVIDEGEIIFDGEVKEAMETIGFLDLTKD